MSGPVLGVQGALLAADVAGRLGDVGQEALDLRPEGLHRPNPTGRSSRRPSWSWSWSTWRSWPAAPGFAVVVVVVGVPSGGLDGRQRSGWAGWPAWAS